MRLRGLKDSSLYTLSVSVQSPSALLGSHDPGFIASPSVFNVEPDKFLPPKGALRLTLFFPGKAPIVQKKLWWGDPSCLVRFRPPQDGDGYLTVEPSPGGLKGSVPLSVELRELDIDRDQWVRFEFEPNDDWKSANPIVIGRAVFGLGDDVDYLYNTQEGTTGWDWFTFEWDGPERLVFFEVDLLDRDVITTLKLYRLEGEKGNERLVEYRKGADPTEVRHDDQGDDLLAFKFLTRVLEPGRYYLAVKPNHPSYELRTAVYEAPPYWQPSDSGGVKERRQAARKAIEVAMRYMIDGGDSFFHNTPRKGGLRVRAENPTDETERCLTCHPGHFTMFSVLSAAQQGYRVSNRSQFYWMMDKLYNAMAPFYGHEGAYWTRFDLAPVNGVSRLGHMIALYENYVSGRRTDFPARAGGFPLVAYRERETLPQIGFDGNPHRNFEFDGNRPISDLRVACDSWVCFVEAYRRTGDRKWKEAADHLAGLIRSGRLKDTEDIVEQTKWALYMSNPAFGYVDKMNRALDDLIRANGQEIFRRQQDDGGWLTAEYLDNGQIIPAWELAKQVKKSDPSLIFFTAETVYVLAMSLYHLGEIKSPEEIVSDPRLSRAVDWILTSQKEFGGWLDPKGELFVTPYLETKWALILLSYLFPNDATAKAAGSDPCARDEVCAPEGYLALIDWLDETWEKRAPQQLTQLIALLDAPDPLVRQKAAEAIGRIARDAVDREGLKAAILPLIAGLKDDCKPVWRACAWALRQLANNGIGLDQITAAFRSDDERVRRGITRIFAQYFFHLTEQRQMAENLIVLLQDPDPMVRIQSLKALWRWWYRTTDFDLRRAVERGFLQLARQEEEPLVRLNIAQALHNILDENTVQFFHNWLRVINREEDKEKARKVRIEWVERPLAEGIAEALRDANALAAETILTAFSYFYLRGGVGNDYDFITFYDEDAAKTLAQALLPYLAHPNARIRLRATQAAIAARAAKDVRLLTGLMNRLTDPDPEVRRVALMSLQHPAFPTDYRTVSVRVAER
ncbi:MAG: HEAT repeat domain-containing protein [Armatimonadetes bacterium]|nr:HEAT repeat domain-containing protein [Armatimonadota bacterium]MDW8121376.1 HEAT repeat domain-containing protein [Armatimonadota bacterium]